MLFTKRVFFCDVKDDAEKADNFLALGPLLRKAATDQKLIGIKLTQPWFDIGTPERLQAINTLVGSV